MTDATQRADRPDTSHNDRPTNPNLVNECYKDFSTLNTRQADKNTANLPNIEFHSGDQKGNGSASDSSGSATRSSDSPATKLISKLGGEDPAEREKATEKLKKLGPTALPDLLKAVKDGDPEVSTRAKSIVQDIVGNSMQTQLSGIQAELMDGVLPGRNAQEQYKKLQKEYDKYSTDPQEKERRVNDLEQMQTVGKDLTAEQNKKIEDQLHDLKNMDVVKYRLQNVKESADLRAEEEEEERLGKFNEQPQKVGQLQPIAPRRPIVPGDIELPNVAPPDIEEWDLRKK